MHCWIGYFPVEKIFRRKRISVKYCFQLAYKQRSLKLPLKYKNTGKFWDSNSHLTLLLSYPMSYGELQQISVSTKKLKKEGQTDSISYLVLEKSLFSPHRFVFRFEFWIASCYIYQRSFPWFWLFQSKFNEWFSQNDTFSVMKQVKKTVC